MTGANKGIGYAIVKKLCKELSGIVILTGNFGDLFTVFIYFISEYLNKSHNFANFIFMTSSLRYSILL